MLESVSPLGVTSSDSHLFIDVLGTPSISARSVCVFPENVNNIRMLLANRSAMFDIVLSCPAFGGL
jgi:hypothetical protein